MPAQNGAYFKWVESSIFRRGKSKHTDYLNTHDLFIRKSTIETKNATMTIDRM